MRVNFIWPSEPFLPSSLFKHYTYLGEVAGHTRQFADTKVVDLSVDPRTRKEVLDVAAGGDINFIPVEVYSVRNAVSLAAMVRQAGSKAVAYGTVAAMNPRVLAPHFDIVLQRDSWEKAIERMIKQPEEFARWTAEGVYLRAEPLASDQWAHPALDLLPTDRYLRIAPKQLEIRVQRGCDRKCSFCAEPIRNPGRKVYHRDPKSTAKFLADHEGNSFYLDAATFSLDKAWVIATSREIAQRAPTAKWRTVTRIDALDEELIREMSAAGCYKIGFGVETLNVAGQKRVGKIVQEKEIREKCRMMRDRNITPRAFFILGLPGQTLQDVQYAECFIRELGIERRWKEYMPVEDVPHLKNIDQFATFERGALRGHNIDGLEFREYLRLLSVER